MIRLSRFLQFQPGAYEDIPSRRHQPALTGMGAGAFKMLVLETVRRQDEPEFVKTLGNFPVGRV